MDEVQWLADRFEERRARLRAVAHRILGSLPEADDAIQETWLRLSRTDHAEVTLTRRACRSAAQSAQVSGEKLLNYLPRHNSRPFRATILHESYLQVIEAQRPKH
jgi:Sigma-70 region 2